tara:strand:- start:97 stop:312 length:216 start_codon:yes stop_codon:yes gene_type:complete
MFIEPETALFTRGSMTSSVISPKMTKPVLVEQATKLEISNQGLSRRVKNLEQEVQVLFVIAGVSFASMILF